LYVSEDIHTIVFAPFLLVSVVIVLFPTTNMPNDFTTLEMSFTHTDVCRQPVGSDMSREVNRQAMRHTSHGSSMVVIRFVHGTQCICNTNW